MEPAAVPWFALHFDRAAHQHDKLLADGQTQAGTTETTGNCTIRLGEFVKDTANAFFCHADTGIAYLEQDAVRFSPFHD